jgi:hypothetical protein
MSFQYLLTGTAVQQNSWAKPVADVGLGQRVSVLMDLSFRICSPADGVLQGLLVCMLLMHHMCADKPPRVIHR